MSIKIYMCFVCPNTLWSLLIFPNPLRHFTPLIRWMNRLGGVEMRASPGLLQNCHHHQGHLTHKNENSFKISQIIQILSFRVRDRTKSTAKPLRSEGDMEKGEAMYVKLDIVYPRFQTMAGWLGLPTDWLCLASLPGTGPNILTPDKCCVLKSWQENEFINKLSDF